MTHFGFAFGVITASVLGGAFVVDHHLKNSPETTVRSTTTTVAEAPAVQPAVTASAGDGDAATKVADASMAIPARASTAIPPRTESAVANVETPKVAKAPARAATSRSTPAPSVPDVQPSTPSEPAPSSSDTTSATPAPQQPEKSEPQPAPSSPPDA